MNHSIRLFVPALALGLVLGCVVVPGGPRAILAAPVVVGSPPPPPPSQRLLTESEAVAVGQQHCQSRGLPCDFQEAHLTGNAVWKVKFKVRDEDEKGHVHLDVDAASGAVLKADEKVKMRGDHGHGRKHD